MEESDIVEGLGATRLTRREMVKKSAAVGAGLAAFGAIEIGGATAAGLQKVKWISPRGTLDVMDDFNLWVPIKMGYFHRLGLDVSLAPGDGSGNLPSVANHQVDMGFPSP